MKCAVVLTLWLLTAIAASYCGLLQAFPPPFPQLLLVALVLLLVIASQFFSPLKNWLRAVDTEVLMLPHLTRFVGFYFLLLYNEGRLPYAFAVPGGIGDILVASAATVILLRWRRGSRMNPATIMAWNIMGFVDILFVVSTAARSAIADPQSMRELTILPLSLLVLFIVPLIIVTHVLIFVRRGR